MVFRFEKIRTRDTGKAPICRFYKQGKTECALREAIKKYYELSDDKLPCRGNYLECPGYHVYNSWEWASKHVNMHQF